MGAWLVVQIVLAVVSVAAAVAAKNAMKDQDRAGLGVTRFGTDQPIPCLAGERILSPIMVYQGVDDDPSKKPIDEYWFGIMVWSVGENEGHTNMWMDDFTLSEFGFSTVTDDFSPGAISDYVDDDYGRITTYAGTDDPKMPAWFSTNYAFRNLKAPDSMAGMDFKGLNVTFVRLKQDKNFKKFPQGVPEFKMRWRGVKMLDLTTGETDKTSDNFINQVYYYLSNDRIGKGFTGWDVDHMTASAHFCKTQVELPDGGFRNLKSSNWIIDTGETIFDNITELLEDQGASFVDGPNGLRIEIDREKTPVMHFDTDDIEKGSGIKLEDIDLDDTYSQVIIRFPDEDNKFEVSEAVYPETNSPEHLAASEHGKPHEEELSTITNYYVAMQRAEMLWKASQDGLNIEVTLGARAFKLEEADVITLGSSLRGWTAKPFLVRELTFTGTGFRIGASEYQSTIFPWSNKTERDQYEDTNLPNPFVLVPLSNVTFNAVFNDPATCGNITWDEPSYYYTNFVVVVTNDDEEQILEQVVHTNKISLPNLPADNYTASISTTNGVANVINTLDFTLEIPAVPSVNVTPNNFGFLIEPVLGYAYAAARFQLRINRTENDFATSDLYGEATVFDISGLLSGREYYFWVRTVNAIGESGWYAFSATTTADASDIRDLVGIDQIESNIEQLQLKSQEYDFNISELVNGASDLEAELLKSVITQANARELLRRKVARNEDLVYAAVDVNPATGEITNRAFSLIDETFNQALVQINGVDGRVTLLSESVDLLDEGLNNLSAEIELLPGVISLIANSTVAEAIQSLTPAHSFNFFDSAQGWTAVNGTLTTPTAQQINVTHGDIQNTGLNFDAQENTAIRISIERTNGDGWTGDVIAVINGVTIPFSGVISEVESSGFVTLNADFRGSENWSGTVTSLRLVLGASTSDEFIITEIIIGKPDAALQELQDVTARVTTAEQEINAVDQRVTTTVETLNLFMGATEDNFTSVSEELDAANSKITNRVFEITGLRDDFENESIRQLLNLIDAANFRLEQTQNNIRFGDAINIIRVQTDEISVLSESLTELTSVTGTQERLVAANSKTLQQAVTDIEGNADALSVILSGVTGEPGYADALLQMESYLTEGGLGARTFIGTDVNNRVTGMVVGDDGVERRIEFSSESVLFLDDEGNNAIYYDLVNHRYFFKGAIEAEAGIFKGLIEAVEGLIAGWVIEEGVLKSSDTGARIELNSDKSRISVFDSVNEKVVMGYLDQLPKHSGSGNWSSNDYGFWARAGDYLVIDGGIDYQSGDFLVKADASVKIFETGGNEIVRLGTDSGKKGMFVYDLSANTIAEFSSGGMTIGNLSDEFISWSVTGGLTLSGSINSESGLIGGWTITESTLHNGNIYLRADTSLIQIGNNVSLSPSNVSFGGGFNWSTAAGLTIDSNANIAGWKVSTNLLKSAENGARVELNASKNRVSIFDANNEKVTMGYLGGLPKFDGSGNWSSNDYGFWARAGDNLIIDGGVDYQSGDFLVSNDASIRIEDGASGNEILRLGTDSGDKGLFIYDGTEESGDSSNTLAKFTDSSVFIGRGSSFISWDPSNGLIVRGSISVLSSIGSETLGDVQQRSNTALQNAANAQGTANTAVQDASNAQGTANTALQDASNAQGTANTAVQNAANAQGTADAANQNLIALQNSLGNLAVEDLISSSMLDNSILVGGYFKTSLIDVDTILGTNAIFSGSLSSVNGSFGTVDVSSGGYIRTAPPSHPDPRVVINGPDNSSPFSFWIGQGSQNENNAYLFVAKDGTKYIDSDFFVGFLPITNSASVSNQLSVTVSHESIGNDVKIDYSASYQAYVSGAYINGWQVEIEIRRGSTVVDTIEMDINTSVSSEPGNPPLQETYARGSVSGFILDTDNASGNHIYGLYMTVTKPGGAVISEVKYLAITTTENRIS